MNTVLRRERERRKWTQEFVAKKLGLTPESVSMIETGRRKPSYDVLVSLLDLFGYDDPRQLFAAADDPISQDNNTTKSKKVKQKTLTS